MRAAWDKGPEVPAAALSKSQTLQPRLADNPHRYIFTFHMPCHFLMTVSSLISLFLGSQLLPLPPRENAS